MIFYSTLLVNHFFPLWICALISSGVRCKYFLVGVILGVLLSHSFYNNFEGTFSWNMMTWWLQNPGAVMFLFEGDFGNVLHTGDCRLTPDCLQKLPMKYIANKGRETKSSLDYLFLDCTFGSCSLKIPSKHSAIQQVLGVLFLCSAVYCVLAKHVWMYIF